MNEDRYQHLDDLTMFDPPLWRCRECDLIVHNQGLHDRWHEKRVTE